MGLSETVAGAIVMTLMLPALVLTVAGMFMYYEKREIVIWPWIAVGLVHTILWPWVAVWLMA